MQLSQLFYGKQSSFAHVLEESTKISVAQNYTQELVPNKLQLSVLNDSWVECRLVYETTGKLMKIN